MALSGTVEGTAMAAAAQGALPTAGTPVTVTQLQNFWKAIAGANVAHFVSNCVVAVASVSGVQTGSGTSGPGAGTVS